MQIYLRQRQILLCLQAVIFWPPAGENGRPVAHCSYGRLWHRPGAITTSLLYGLSLQLLGLALNIRLERGQVARAFVGRHLCAVVEHLQSKPQAPAVEQACYATVATRLTLSVGYPLISALSHGFFCAVQSTCPIATLSLSAKAAASSFQVGASVLQCPGAAGTGSKQPTATGADSQLVCKRQAALQATSQAGPDSRTSVLCQSHGRPGTHRTTAHRTLQSKLFHC
jgi:hypothetical protein